ncbi:MAG: glycosyltransferase family 4 protein [Candidatus Omnitrophica bacterium]|nr:glycosyltransferase family 4 protein [Candidatus Omnitrophota bacterium]
MKILFVNKYSEIAGGVEYYINSLSRIMRKKGHTTGIIHWDKVLRNDNFCDFFHLPQLWDEELSFSVSAKESLDYAVGKFCPDIIYLHNMENGKAIEYFSTKGRTVRYIHGYKTVDPDGKMLLRNPLEVNRYPLGLSCFVRAYTRCSMPRNIFKGIRSYSRAKNALEATKKLNRIIVASEYMKGTLVNNGIKKSKIFVLPYFVDYKDPGVNADPEPGRMLFAGRIAEGKGLDVLLDILRFIKKDYILDVVGTGPMEQSCQRKIFDNSLSGKVIFHGWREHENTAEFYKRAGFIILPSIWPEPFGICGIEAAFFGRPAVAFNVGGIGDWLTDNKTGFLVAPYSKEAMAEKITYLLDNPGKAAEMGGRARGTVLKKYLPAPHIKQLETIFTDNSL